MTKEEIEIASDKVSHQAWQILKRKILFFATILLILVGYFGWDIYSNRKAIKEQLELALNQAKEVEKTRESVQKIKANLELELKQTSDLQNQIKLDQEQLGKVMASEQDRFRSDLRDLSSSLLVLIDDLDTIPEDIAPGLAAKLAQKSSEIKETVRALDLSFCKFGILSKQDQGWSEELFQIEGQVADSGLPEVGTVLVARTDINLRSGFPDHVQDKGLIFRPVAGLLKEGDRIVLKEIRLFELKSSIHYWISFVPQDKS